MGRCLAFAPGRVLDFCVHTMRGITPPVGGLEGRRDQNSRIGGAKLHYRWCFELDLERQEAAAPVSPGCIPPFSLKGFGQ